MDLSTIRKRKRKEEIEATTPDHIDLCGNPECSNTIPRWNNLESSRRPRFCSRFCSRKCRNETSMRGLKKTLDYPKDKPFRTTICRRGVSLCANYKNCSDGEFTGRPWKYEKNGGQDCFIDPETNR